MSSVSSQWRFWRTGPGCGGRCSSCTGCVRPAGSSLDPPPRRTAGGRIPAEHRPQSAQLSANRPVHQSTSTAVTKHLCVCCRYSSHGTVQSGDLSLDHVLQKKTLTSSSAYCCVLWGRWSRFSFIDVKECRGLFRNPAVLCGSRAV